MRLRLLLRSLAKLFAVIVVAGAAGVGLGVGLSQLTGDDSTSSSADTSTIRSDVSAATSTGGDSPATIDPDTTAGSSTQAQTNTPSSVRVRVVASVLHRASTPTGRRSNRARLSVHVRVTNRGGRTIANVEPALVAGKRVRADPSAGETSRSLLRPIRPGSTADGTLRFETAGAVTARLVRARRAQLRIAGRTATLKVRIGRPV